MSFGLQNPPPSKDLTLHPPLGSDTSVDDVGLLNSQVNVGKSGSYQSGSNFPVSTNTPPTSIPILAYHPVSISLSFSDVVYVSVRLANTFKLMPLPLFRTMTEVSFLTIRPYFLLQFFAALQEARRT